MVPRPSYSSRIAPDRERKSPRLEPRSHSTRVVALLDVPPEAALRRHAMLTLTIASMVGLYGNDWKALADEKDSQSVEFKRHCGVESGTRGAEAPRRCRVDQILGTVRPLRAGGGLGSGPVVRSRDGCR